MARVECILKLVHEFHEDYVPNEVDIRDLKRALLRILLSNDNNTRIHDLDELVELIIAIKNMKCKVIQ